MSFVNVCLAGYPFLDLINCLVPAAISAVIIIEHMAGSAPRSPVKPGAFDAFGIDMTPEASPPQKIIHKHGRGSGVERGIGLRATVLDPRSAHKWPGAALS